MSRKKIVEMEREIFEGLGVMTMLVVIVMIAVLVAMCVDCVSGWRKAKVRGDERTSYAFSRSLTKFLIYEGICIIGGCMDVMAHFAWYQFMDSTYLVPILTIVFGTILCLVEAWSVKEKAEDKQRKQIENATLLLGKVFGNEAVKKFIEDTLRQQMKERKKETSVDGEADLRRTELVSDNF